MMMSFLDRQHTMVVQPPRPSPYHDVTMHQGDTYRLVFPTQPTPQEDGWQAQRNRDNRRTEVMLVLVLVQRQPGSRLVAIDEAGIRLKTLKAGARSSASSQIEKYARHTRPRLAAFWIHWTIAITRTVCHPAVMTTIRYCYRHAKTARSGHVAKRSFGCNTTKFCENSRFVLPCKPAQYHGTRRQLFPPGLALRHAFK